MMGRMSADSWSEARSQPRPPGLAWTVAALLMAPLLYVLSVPMVCLWANPHHAHPTWIPPSHLAAYCKPYRWLRYESSMSGPLMDYETWCVGWVRGA
jgi:hypothetical protein